MATVRDEIVGIGRYEAGDRDGADLDPGARDGSEGPRSAEVAFNIADAHRGRGIGSVLLEHLAAAARENGITCFIADVLPTNQRMLGVFREAGYEVAHHLDDGVIEVSFDIDPTERSIAVMAAREHRAESLSMRALLNARSVVVVGASRDASSFGARVLQAITEGRFTGPVHVVNREALEVGGAPAYAAVDEVPGPVDLAVVTVPAAEVPEVLAQCVDLGVKGAVIVSSGFAEIGQEGVELQHQVVRLARAAGIRVIGPNSFGIINTDPAVSLNASVAPALPTPGALALFSQSGGLGVAVLSSAQRRGLGLSSFLSAGNRADVSGNDAHAVLARRPPHRRGRAVPGERRQPAQVLPHRPPAGPGQADDRRQERGQRVRGAPGPRGPRVDGPAGGLRRDAPAGGGHPHREPPPAVRRRPGRPAPAAAARRPGGRARQLAGAERARRGRLCLLGPGRGGGAGDGPFGGHAEEFDAALAQVYARHDVDAVVASFIPPLQAATDDVQLALQRRADGSGRTTVACFIGPRLVGSTTEDRAPVPAYPLPEDAVRALAAVVRYAQWRRRETGPLVDPEGVDSRSARALVEQVVAADPDGRRLTREEVVRLLACYGVQVWSSEEVDGPDAAAEAARRTGYPVVLKASRLRHRLDTGGIRLDITTRPGCGPTSRAWRRSSARGPARCWCSTWPLAGCPRC